MPQNVLLGSGIIPEPVLKGHINVVNLRTPAWRFHKDFPEGKICKTDAELDQLDTEGWLDHPGKVRLLPGHEKVWEAQKLLETGEVGKPDEVKEEVVVEYVKSEDAIKADILKAESDKVEANRLESERKTEEKRLKEEEKCLEAEEKITYEDAKNPPGPRLCTLCGMTFNSLKGLNDHGMRMHR